jgi:hypothetical protein
LAFQAQPRLIDNSKIRAGSEFSVFNNAYSGQTVALPHERICKRRKTEIVVFTAPGDHHQMCSALREKT